MFSPSMTNASPCLICHEPVTWKREKLRRIEEACRKASTDRHGIRASFMWGIHSRCKYGLPCTKLAQHDRDCTEITRRIEERLVDAVYSDDRTYHSIYEMCRGDFPQVCRELERIRAMMKKEDKDNE